MVKDYDPNFQLELLVFDLFLKLDVLSSHGMQHISYFHSIFFKVYLSIILIRKLSLFLTYNAPMY